MLQRYKIISSTQECGRFPKCVIFMVSSANKNPNKPLGQLPYQQDERLLSIAFACLCVGHTLKSLCSSAVQNENEGIERINFVAWRSIQFSCLQHIQICHNPCIDTCLRSNQVFTMFWLQDQDESTVILINETEQYVFKAATELQISILTWANASSSCFPKAELSPGLSHASS